MNLSKEQYGELLSAGFTPRQISTMQVKFSNLLNTVALPEPEHLRCIAELRQRLEQAHADIAGLHDQLEEPQIAQDDYQLNKLELEQLRQQLETERMRLAACGVVALSNTPESAAKARDMFPDYRSASCDDVARAVDREMKLRQQLAEREKYVTLLRDAVVMALPEIAMCETGCSAISAMKKALDAPEDEFQSDIQAAAGGLSQTPL